MKFATIEYNYIDDLTPRIAEVAIVSDEFFADPESEIDERIFFYFTETEFEIARRGGYIDGLEFSLLNVHDDCEECIH